MRLLFATLLLTLAGSAVALDENDAIALSAFDYIDGWYEGDGIKMEQSLHPELAHRELYKIASGSRLDQLGALSVIRDTIAGTGDKTAEAERIKEVIILDVDGDIASVKVVLSNRSVYMQLAKFAQHWAIVNVLWQATASN